MKDKYFDQIERYFSNELTDDELREFQQELSSNAELQEEMDMHEAAQNVLEGLMEKDLLETFDEWKKKETAAPRLKTRPRLRRLYTTMSVAASLLLLVGFFGVRYLTGQYTNDKLLADNYAKPSFDDTRSSPEIPNSSDLILNDGLSAIKNGKYDQGIEILGTISQESEQYIESRYYMAHAYYLSTKYQDAIQIFKEVAGSNDNRFNERGEWFGAVSYLAANNTGKEMYALLDKIANEEGHSYQEHASRLRSQLNSIWRR